MPNARHARHRHAEKVTRSGGHARDVEARNGKLLRAEIGDGDESNAPGDSMAVDAGIRRWNSSLSLLPARKKKGQIDKCRYFWRGATLRRAFRYIAQAHW